MRIISLYGRGVTARFIAFCESVLEKELLKTAISEFYKQGTNLMIDRTYGNRVHFYAYSVSGDKVVPVKTILKELQKLMREVKLNEHKVEINLKQEEEHE